MATGRRQKRMGPAPFASFEDLSDEMESPGEPVVRLPGINEDVTPSAPRGLTPSTPRIDISRASSSSHHEDSRDSTPERELFQVPDQPCARLGVAFTEEGAMDLRSSTEELDFQEQLPPPRKPRAPSPAQSEPPPHTHHRKDSQSSEVGALLSISGRTSRLSSIGSQGSRVSNASHLSVTSGMSRSPSPHKMLLETSFCGSKSGTPTPGAQHTNNKVEAEMMERVLLSRKHDPTEAVLAEGISIECRRKIQVAPLNQHPIIPDIPLSPLIQPINVPLSPVSNQQYERSIQPPPVIPPAREPPEKPARKLPNTMPVSEVIIKVDKPPDAVVRKEKEPVVSGKLPGKKIVAESGIEYTFIPLKGPLPMEVEASQGTNERKVKKIPDIPLKKADLGEPQYIRIKLKPDHLYTDEPPTMNVNHDVQKPVSLDLNNGTTEKLYPRERDSEPKIERITLRQNNSRTPSPSVSRKSSFTSIFRSKESSMSPESPTVPGRKRSSLLSERSRSRSKSRDRATGFSVARSSTESIDSNKSKHKSVFALFKSKPKTCQKSKPTPDITPPETLSSLEFTFDKPPIKKYYEVPLEGDSIIIPLHSPSEQPDPITSGQDLEDLSLGSELNTSDQRDFTQEVMSALERNMAEHRGFVQTQTPLPEKIVDHTNHRQSSTSSENIVFSTNLGSNNEIFTTKLPKHNREPKRTEIPRLENDNEKESASAVQDGDIKTDKKEDKIKHETKKKDKKKNSYEEQTKEEKSRKPEPEEKSFSDDMVMENGLEYRGEISMIGHVIDKVVDVVEASERGNDSSDTENEGPTSVRKRQDSDESSSEHERKGLVLQQDSFEDELPYIPTTLPLERSVAVPIVPIKQRATFEIKTCPIDRPRSTTPINPSCLEDYCEDVFAAVSAERSEKLKISLPRDDPSSTSIGKAKSPRKWTEFVPQQQQSQQQHSQQSTPPPPLPPRGAPKDWINFEDIPERRKPPKRIQTIPSRGPVSSQVPVDDNVVYSYVNPEDCKCECHETGASVRREDELPLLTDRRSDSSPDSPAPKRSPRSPIATATPSESTNAFPHVSS